MNKEKALELMENAPRSKTKKSRPCPPMSEYQAYTLIQDWLVKLPPGHKISGMLEKRVWQIAKNQIKPRYTKDT